jgi:hypothetical protein
MHNWRPSGACFATKLRQRLPEVYSYAWVCGSPEMTAGKALPVSDLTAGVVYQALAAPEPAASARRTPGPPPCKDWSRKDWSAGVLWRLAAEVPVWCAQQQACVVCAAAGMFGVRSSMHVWCAQQQACVVCAAACLSDAPADSGREKPGTQPCHARQQFPRLSWPSAWQPWLQPGPCRQSRASLRPLGAGRARGGRAHQRIIGQLRRAPAARHALQDCALLHALAGGWPGANPASARAAAHARTRRMSSAVGMAARAHARERSSRGLFMTKQSAVRRVSCLCVCICSRGHARAAVCSAAWRVRS